MEGNRNKDKSGIERAIEISINQKLRWGNRNKDKSGIERAIEITIKQELKWRTLEMINSELKVNGNKISDFQELEKFFASEHFTCEIGDCALEVEYSKERAAFIGWLNGDEEVFYYNNGSGNDKPVDLIINVCPEERMMCYDAEVIKDIVYYFCETGERNPKYNWIEDLVE